MHARLLVELAARLALESVNPANRGENNFEFVKQYWTASKCRLESWQRALKIFSDDLQVDDPWHDPWPATEVVVQEILISELLTRVWSAVLIQCDQTSQNGELTGAAQSVFISHMEASNQAMRLLVAQPLHRQAAVERLDVQRRRIERWTDLLLGCLPNSSIAERFAHDRNRMLDFAADRRLQSANELRQSNRILLASLNAELKSHSNRFAANPELNRQIAAGVMAFLSHDQFDSIGLPKSPNQIWIEQSLDETDAYVKEFRRLYESAQRPHHADRIRDLMRSAHRRPR
jgi:hypothetical protein